MMASAGPIRDVEAAIDAQEGVHVDDGDLNREVEGVEAGPAVVPGRVIDGARREVGAGAEAGAQGDQERREEQDLDLGAEAPAAELVDAAGGAAELGEHDTDGQDEDGEEGGEGAVGAADELDVPIDAVDVGVESIALLGDTGDQSDEEEDDDGVVGDEEPVDESMPAKFWMASSENSLCEEDVDDDYNDHTGIDEYIRGNGDGNVILVCGPD